MKQHQIILKVLEEAYPNWIMSYDLEKVSTKWGYIGTAGLKRCRELRAKGQIEQVDEGQYIKYRFISDAPPKVLPIFARENVSSIEMKWNNT